MYWESDGTFKWVMTLDHSKLPKALYPEFYQNLYDELVIRYSKTKMLVKDNIRKYRSKLQSKPKSVVASSRSKAHQEESGWQKAFNIFVDKAKIAAEYAIKFTSDAIRFGKRHIMANKKVFTAPARNYRMRSVGMTRSIRSRRNSKNMRGDVYEGMDMSGFCRKCQAKARQRYRQQNNMYARRDPMEMIDEGRYDDYPAREDKEEFDYRHGDDYNVRDTVKTIYKTGKGKKRFSRLKRATKSFDDKFYDADRDGTEQYKPIPHKCQVNKCRAIMNKLEEIERETMNKVEEYEPRTHITRKCRLNKCRAKMNKLDQYETAKMNRLDQYENVKINSVDDYEPINHTYRKLPTKCRLNKCRAKGNKYDQFEGAIMDNNLDKYETTGRTRKKIPTKCRLNKCRAKINKYDQVDSPVMDDDLDAYYNTAHIPKKIPTKCRLNKCRGKRNKFDRLERAVMDNDLNEHENYETITHLPRKCRLNKCRAKRKKEGEFQ